MCDVSLKKNTAIGQFVDLGVYTRRHAHRRFLFFSSRSFYLKSFRFEEGNGKKRKKTMSPLKFWAVLRTLFLLTEVFSMLFIHLDFIVEFYKCRR